MKTLFSFLGVFMFLVFSCASEGDSETSLEIPFTALAIEQEDGKLAFAHPEINTRRAVARYMVNDVRIFNDPSLLPQHLSIENMELKPTKNGKAYLFFILKRGDTSLNVASELNNKGGFYTLAGDTHSCKGNPCGLAGFVEDTDGNITGCKCTSNPAGHADHTITRTEGKALVIKG